MMVSNEEINENFSIDSIRKRAIERWDSKTISSRLRTSSKYKHIFLKYKLPSNDWSNSFDGLTSHQRNILLKGELIRTYDSLPNADKSRIKKKFGLSHFSSKWFKLIPRDKKILLNSILHNE